MKDTEMQKKQRTMAQIRAERRNDAKRRGTPTFSSVRLTNKKEKEWIEDVISQYGKRRYDALIDAFKLLEERVIK